MIIKEKCSFKNNFMQTSLIKVMTIRLIIIFILFSCITFGQEKPMVFYNESGKKTSKKEFLNTIDYSKNLDLYFENDSTQLGVLVKRQKFGQLDKNTFEDLKNYLTALTNRKIDSTQNIVINYLTAYPKKEDISDENAEWNIREKKYLKRLHKKASISQFWINSPECDNLEYYHKDRINWITDKEDVFNILFFPYGVKYGNFLLIKPDGKFYYYLGEHSNNQIIKTAKKFFNPL